MMTSVVTNASLMVAVVGIGQARTVGIRSRSAGEDHRHEYTPADARAVGLALLAAAQAIELGVELGLPTLDGSATEDQVDAYIAEHRPLERLPRVEVAG